MSYPKSDEHASSGVLHILLIDDDPTEALLIGKRLRQIKLTTNHTEFTLLRAQNLGEGVATAKQQHVDIFMLDLGLPDCTELDGVKRLTTDFPEIPIVVLTGNDDEQVGLDAVRLGAQDYLIKGDFTSQMLVRTLRYALERQRLLAEVQIARREENEIKDRFLSHVSHELRTPLTAIMQFVAILQDGIAGELNPEQAEYLAIVRRNSEQLKQMIGSLMEVTRAGNGKLEYNPQVTTPTAVVARSVEALEKAAVSAGVELTYDLPDNLPEIVADPPKVVQVISNLISNALKFTPACGSVKVRASNDPSHPGWVRFTVTDTGCGIQEDQLELVFERMYQIGDQTDVSRKGLGLGLHICKEVLQLHGGEIWAESNEGEGSSFHFTLPTYSLRRLTNHVTTTPNGLAESLVLLAVEIRPNSPASEARGVDDATTECAQVMNQCLLGVCDVVLPLRKTSDRVGRVFALARADAPGGIVIRSRIEEELGRHTSVRRLGFDVQVRSECFNVHLHKAADVALDEVTEAIRLDIQRVEQERPSSTLQL